MNKGNLPSRESNGEVAPSALELTLLALRPLLDEPETVELCINRPLEAHIKGAKGWRRENLPFADFDWCRRFAELIANSLCQRIDETTPMLSGVLPTGEQVQVVMPPVTSQGCVAITIHCSPKEVRSIEELAQLGAFRATCIADRGGSNETRAELNRLRVSHKWEEFIRLAIDSRQNVLVSGGPGAGKTVWMNALLKAIPARERLVVIGDAPGISHDTHPNHVALSYSRMTPTSPTQLFETARGMRPERLAIMELDGRDYFEFLKLISSHVGVISSVCAASAEGAFDSLTMLIKQTHDGKGFTADEIKSFLLDVINIVILCKAEGQRLLISEIWC